MELPKEQIGEFKNIEEIQKEKEKLKREINRRANKREMSNMRALRLQAMREFLQKMPPEEKSLMEKTAEEENERRNKKMIQAMDNYNRAASRNKCTTDTSTIYEEDGKEACDVVFSTITESQQMIHAN